MNPPDLFFVSHVLEILWRSKDAIYIIESCIVTFYGQKLVNNKIPGRAQRQKYMSMEEKQSKQPPQN
jgi:hypothetical protein